MARGNKFQDKLIEYAEEIGCRFIEITNGNRHNKIFFARPSGSTFFMTVSRGTFSETGRGMDNAKMTIRRLLAKEGR